MQQLEPNATLLCLTMRPHANQLADIIATSTHYPCPQHPNPSPDCSCHPAGQGVLQHHGPRGMHGVGAGHAHGQAVPVQMRPVPTAPARQPRRRSDVSLAAALAQRHWHSTPPLWERGDDNVGCGVVAMRDCIRIRDSLPQLPCTRDAVGGWTMLIALLSTWFSLGYLRYVQPHRSFERLPDASYAQTHDAHSPW